MSDKRGKGGGTASAARLPVLNLRPRDERFVVIAEGRAARAGHSPLQVAIPQELHRRLRYEALGSINQVMVALVRQALVWLDADHLTLRAEVNPDPEPPSLEVARVIPEGLEGLAKRDFERCLDHLWPNARLSTIPRVDDRVVLQPERQPRADAQLTQIALPPEVQQRLLRDGVGAVSQLVISLARYCLRRLDEEELTLEILPVDTGSHKVAVEGEVSEGASAISEGPSLTVAQLINELSKLPPEAFVVFEEQADCWWDLQEVELFMLDPGNPYDGFSNGAGEPKTPMVVLRGETSVMYEPSEDDPNIVDF